MTYRCRVIIALGLLGMAAGIFRSQDTLALLSLSMLIWIFIAWFRFKLRIALLLPQLRLLRTVNARPAEKTKMWSGRTVAVELNVAASKGTIPPCTMLADWVPDLLKPISGSPNRVTLEDVPRIRLCYRAEVLAAGTAKFDGLSLQFRESCGLFAAEHFVESRIAVACLPSFSNLHETLPSVKRINSLPQHGIHRLSRAGLGSELFDIREYQSGDPPKSIAWKVSARRDRLMTRQYESEVPVRVTLFLDASPSVWLGSYGNRLIDQMRYLAASVARSAISSGDLVGYSLLGAAAQRCYSSPAGGERGFYQVLGMLAGLVPPELPPSQPADAGVVQTALQIAKARYPQLMSARINRVPFTLTPVLPWSRARLQERIRFALLASELYSLPIDSVGDAIYNRSESARLAARFILDHSPGRMPAALAVTTDDPDLDLSGAWAEAIQRSIARARDNELFVIIADLFGAQSQFEPLLSAVKVAISRHHRVVFVCPMPELPDPPPVSATDSSDSRLAEHELERRAALRAEQYRVASLARDFKRQARQIGASIAFSTSPATLGLVLAEAQLAGSGRHISSRGSRI